MDRIAQSHKKKDFFTLNSDLILFSSHVCPVHSSCAKAPRMGIDRKYSIANLKTCLWQIAKATLSSSKKSDGMWARLHAHGMCLLDKPKQTQTVVPSVFLDTSNFKHGLLSNPLLLQGSWNDW